MDGLESGRITTLWIEAFAATFLPLLPNPGSPTPLVRFAGTSWLTQASISIRLYSKGRILGHKRGKRNGKNLPPSWGVNPEKMITKRRCLLVFDGNKELCRDEMMMSSEWEVRSSLNGVEGGAEVSDLDYWTVMRANAFLDAVNEPTPTSATSTSTAVTVA